MPIIRAGTSTSPLFLLPDATFAKLFNAVETARPFASPHKEFSRSILLSPVVSQLPAENVLLLTCAAMLGIVYLLIALGCWTVWAVLSARLGCKLSPLNCLLWTGLMYAAITLGGFVVHHRQLKLPVGNDWLLLGIFCVASTAASLGYYASMRYLPSTVVIPLSHLYLVLGPVLLAILERRSMSWSQLSALGVIMFGVLFFLAASPGESEAPARSDRQLADTSPRLTSGSMAAENL